MLQGQRDFFLLEELFANASSYVNVVTGTNPKGAIRGAVRPLLSHRPFFRSPLYCLGWAS